MSEGLAAVIVVFLVVFSVFVLPALIHGTVKYYCFKRLLKAGWIYECLCGYDNFGAPDEDGYRDWFDAFRRLRYLEKIKHYNLPDTTPRELEEPKGYAAGGWVQ
jgi:hypothetical protein